MQKLPENYSTFLARNSATKDANGISLLSWASPQYITRIMGVVVSSFTVYTWLLPGAPTGYILSWYFLYASSKSILWEENWSNSNNVFVCTPFTGRDILDSATIKSFDMSGSLFSWIVILDPKFRGPYLLLHFSERRSYWLENIHWVI